MIVVTTPTGNIGSRVARALAERGEEFRVVVRDPARLDREIRDAADLVAEGSHENAELLTEACRGADQLFLVIPPSMTLDDTDAYYRRFAEAANGAVRSSGVARVVYVSGTGLGAEKRAGAVSASYLAEEILAAGEAALTVLHCGTFMENLLHSVQSILAQGRFSTTVPGDVKLPWVAVKDIADAAVSVLLDPEWKSGKGSVGVLGPRDMSYDEIAEEIGDAIGRSVAYETITSEELIARMTGFGASGAAARGLAEIYDSMIKGTFSRVERTPDNLSPTTFREWCAETLKPALMR